MDQEVKDLWVAALRDPNRVQGSTRLHYITGDQCCLGVLCELAAENNVIPGPTVVDDYYVYDHENAVLPEKVRVWAGLSTENPRVHAEYSFPSLALLNDEGVPFARIADIIDEQTDDWNGVIGAV